MSEIDNRKELSDFFKKRRAKTSTVKVASIESITSKPLPWYRRPLDKSEFSYRLAKNGRYYVRHKEWSNCVWIGPYRNVEDIKAIVDSYVMESLKNNLERKCDSSIHSVIIDNPEEFF